MRFIYMYPETLGPDGDLLDAGPLADLAAACEAAGFEGFGLTEHPAPGAKWLATGGHQSLDPFVGLAHVAAVTERIKLLTHLSVMPYRNPNLLAKTAASVDKVSGGRFILGVGTGYLRREFEALGVDFEERNALFDEALDVLPLHWSGEPFSYAGRHFRASDIQARPIPVQHPIPIWVGGNAKITLRRIAERCQGWMPLIMPPEAQSTVRSPTLGTVAEVGVKIRELRDMAGERADQIEVAAPYMAAAHGPLDEDVERHRQDFGEMDEAGIGWAIVTTPTRSRAASLEQIEAFGKTYISS